MSHDPNGTREVVEVRELKEEEAEEIEEENGGVRIVRNGGGS